MREIKFRAWDKENGCWASIDSVALCDDGSVAYLLSADGEPPYLEEDVEIMQYTGLKDVNGVEIYEGDIVEGGIEGRRSLIKISSYGWLKQALEDEFNKTYCNYKIIGNKFENPELLEAK